MNSPRNTTIILNNKKELICTFCKEKLIESSSGKSWQCHYCYYTIRKKWLSFDQCPRCNTLFYGSGYCPKCKYFYQKDYESQLYLYFLSFNENSPIKIGVTDDVEKRISQLQGGIPYKLELIKKVKICNRDTEGFVHDKFESFRIQREWFERNEKLLKFIDNINDPYETIL